jgi:periplasmic divalent cation tolerance protein
MAEAERLARLVLDRRLAACANAWPLRSWYWWEGRLEASEEAGLLLKTRASLFPDLEQAVRAAHPDRVPCIVAWPVVVGSSPYLAWVRAETGSGGGLRPGTGAGARTGGGAAHGAEEMMK